MSLPPFSPDDQIKVLLVRHGESTNNVTMKHVYMQHLDPGSDKPLRQQLDSGSDAAAAAERAWLEQRSSDPALTDVGQAEAVAFGRHYAPLLRAASPGGVRVFVSPFLRTCQTAAPLVQVLGSHAKVTLRGDICEVGGCYTAAAAATTAAAAAAAAAAGGG